MIDDVDALLLDVLQRQGRAKRNELAKLTGLSIPAISERMRKLEEAGLIRGYAALVDHRALGCDVSAFIFVTVDSSKHYAAFLRHVQETAELLECHAVTGQGTHLLKIRTTNTASLEKLLSRIQSWEGVVQTTTNVVLSSPKEEVAIPRLSSRKIAKVVQSK